MIVWLASYPRCGNTFARLLIKDVFGVVAHTTDPRRRPPEHLGISQEKTKTLGDMLGAAWFSGSWEEAYKKASQTDEMFLVKTHAPPIDDAPAIYVARDGRASVVSYLHFLRVIERDETVSLRDVILGNVGYGGWSDHFRAWSPLDRDNCAMIKYEQIVSDPEKVIDRIGPILKARPRGRFVNRFEALQALDPSFFRSGRTDQWTEELSEDDHMLFWDIHGEVMDLLGYTDRRPGTSALMRYWLRKRLARLDRYFPAGKRRLGQ